VIDLLGSHLVRLVVKTPSLCIFMKDWRHCDIDPDQFGRKLIM